MSQPPSQKPDGSTYTIKPFGMEALHGTYEELVLNLLSEILASLNELVRLEKLRAD